MKCCTGPLNYQWSEITSCITSAQSEHCPSVCWPFSCVYFVYASSSDHWKFKAQLWCPIACLHSAPSPVFVMYTLPQPLQKACESFVRFYTESNILLGSHCHSTQHLLGTAVGNVPAWFVEAIPAPFFIAFSHQWHPHHAPRNPGDPCTETRAAIPLESKIKIPQKQMPARPI